MKNKRFKVFVAVRSILCDCIHYNIDSKSREKVDSVIWANTWDNVWINVHMNVYSNVGFFKPTKFQLEKAFNLL